MIPVYTISYTQYTLQFKFLISVFIMIMIAAAAFIAASKISSMSIKMLTPALSLCNLSKEGGERFEEDIG